MKKNVFLLLMLFMSTMWWQSSAQIVVGPQNGNTSNIPIYGCYGYSYTQQLVFPGQINASGDITSISFYYSSGSFLNSTDWTIYLGHTSKAEFTSTSDWVALASMSQVYTGTVTFPAAGNWMTITFDTPFNYNNVDNLVVAVDENENGYGCSPSFGRTLDVGSNRSIYYRNDSTNPDPAAPPAANGRNNYISYMTLGGITAACPNPTALASTVVNTTTVDVSWTAGDVETDWNVSWGAPGYTPDVDDIGTAMVSPTPMYQITGLTADTSYNVYVQADCGGGETSGWTGPVSFTTPLVVTPIWEEGFADISTPDGWTRTGWTIGSTRGATGNPGNNIYKNLYGSGSSSSGSFTTVNVGPIAAGNAFSFNFKASLYSSPYNALSPGSGSFKVLVSTDFGATFSEIDDVALPAVNTWQSESYDLSAYVGDIITVRIEATRTAEDFDLAFDNFFIGTPPTCLAPTALTVDAVSTTTADIEWIAGDSETAWNISWGTPGYTVGGAGEINTGTAGPTETYTINMGLTANTEYEFYVQADCGGGDESGWAGPVSFRTACDIVSVFPYEQNFNGVTTPNLPNCWSENNTNADGDKWSTYATYGVGGSIAAGLYTDGNSGSNDDYLITPQIALTGGERLRFSVRARSASEPNDFRVVLSTTDQDPASFTEELLPLTVIGTTTYQEYIIDLDAYTGNVYMAIHVPSGGLDGWYIYVDDVFVETIPTCPGPTALTADAIATTTADISWTLGDSETAWNVSWGAPGYTPGVDDIGTDSAATESYQITGLTAGSEYDVYVQADCGGDTSAWTGPLTINTLIVNDNLCDALPLTMGATSAGDAYTNIGATVQPNEPNGSCWFGTSSPQTVWFSFIAPSSGNVTATTDIAGGTLTDTHIAIYEAPTDCADLLTLGAQVGCSEDDGELGFGYLSVATMTGLTPGDTYYIQVDGYNSDTGTFGLEVHDDGFVYEAGVWTPSDPSVDAGPTDNILVVDGVTSFTTAMEVNNINVMSGATLNIEGMLTINGDITNDGDLVFVSSATANGELAEVSGSSSITGDVTVERYMKNKRSYRMVSSSVTTTSSIHDNWQEGATSNMDNPNPGFGTHITGTTTDQTNGFDGTITGNPSMFTVNVGSQMFEAISNTDVNTLTAGDAYLLFVRGDRSIDLSNDLSAGETVIRATGSLVTGTQTQNFATTNASDLFMFGNPYQSAVDVNDVFAGSTNLNTAFYYVYDPTLGAHGAYVTVNLPGGTNTSGSDANEFLQPGQGAQAAAFAAGASSVIFNETDKAPGDFTATSRPVAANDMLTVQLFTTENFNNGGPVHDSFGIIFAEGNNNGLTSADAIKPMNFYENLGVNQNGTYLSIEQRDMPQPAEVYSLYTTGYQQSEYTLKVIVDGLEASFLYLDDHFTGTTTLLEAGDTTYSYVADANNPLSIATDRFSIRTEQRLGVDDNSLLAGIRLFPNPLSGDTFYINAPKLNGEQLMVSISDLTGRSIYEQTLDCRANTVTVPMGDNMSSGVYLVTLTNGGEAQTYRLIKE